MYLYSNNMDQSATGDTHIYCLPMRIFFKMFRLDYHHLERELIWEVTYNFFDRLNCEFNLLFHIFESINKYLKYFINFSMLIL